MEMEELKRPSDEVLSRIHALKEKKGMLAMIEPETGDWFLGKTTLEAFRKAKEKYPNKIFYCIRIGFPFAHEHKGGIRKI